MNGNGYVDTAVRQTAKNLNTILLYVLIATGATVCGITWNSSVTLARLEGSLVTRPEVEAKIAEVKAMYSAQQTDLTALKLALAERGIKAK